MVRIRVFGSCGVDDLTVMSAQDEGIDQCWALWTQVADAIEMVRRLCESWRYPVRWYPRLEARSICRRSYQIVVKHRLTTDWPIRLPPRQY